MENILKGRSQLLYIKISSIGVGSPRLNDDELKKKNSRKSVNKQSK